MHDGGHRRTPAPVIGAGETLLGFALGFLCFIPKEYQAFAGAGTFNIGAIDAFILFCALMLASKGRMVFWFANRHDLRLVVAFVVAICVSLAFARHPYPSVKAFLKVFEAAVLYLYFVRNAGADRLALYTGLLAGGVASLFLVDPHSTDSKIHSSSYMIASIYFLLTWLGGRPVVVKPAGIPLDPAMCFAFFTMSFALYPKKGAVLAFLVAVLMLFAFGILKLRLKTIIGLLILLPLGAIVLGRSASFQVQIVSFASFLSGGREGGADSDYVRLLQFLALPYLAKSGSVLGYGYSQSGAGIDEGLYAHFCNISERTLGFVPRQGLLDVGANFFSDNIYFTMFAELGYLVAIPVAFLAMSLWHYSKRNRILFIYITCILVFSMSIIDIFIYRGTNIFFLNAVLYAHLVPEWRPETAVRTWSEGTGSGFAFSNGAET